MKKVQARTLLALEREREREREREVYLEDNNMRGGNSHDNT